MKKYYISELFYSVQGEGARCGTANVFVRTSGCNLRCGYEVSEVSPGFGPCDTDFSGSVEYGLTTLCEKIREIGGCCKNIIFTGGEPALQLDEPLCRQLKIDGYYLAVETNGTKDLSHLPLDWISCSPKTAEHTIKVLRCDEYRYVRAAGQALPKPLGEAAHYYLSPFFRPDWSVDYESLEWCIKLVKENPTWRLSTQNQKFWRIR